MRNITYSRALGLLLVPILTGAALGQDDLIEHPVLGKYPSVEQLEEAIDSFKADHPQEYATAYRDLTEAVRFNLEIERPQVGPQPVVMHLRDWFLYLPPLKPAYETISDEERIKNKRLTPEFVRFLREHIDELTLEYTPRASAH